MYKVALITAKKSGPIYLIQRSGIDLGTLSLEAYLAEHANDIDVLVTEEIDDIATYRPDLVGISTTSENYGLAMRIAQQVRERCACQVVIGGAHITDCPESLSRDFDLGVRGEGEDTFLEVIQALKSGEPYQDIEGIVYHGPKGPVLTPLRKPIADLGTLPLINRVKWVDKIGMAFLMTLRGCPFHCWFCAARENYTGLRYFPVDHVIAELKDIVDHFHPQCIRIFDDVFNLRKDRVKEITSRMIAEGLTQDVSYVCWVRAELLDQEYVDLLKRANFIYVSFGVESADEVLMKKMKGGRIDLKSVQSAIDMLYNAGIEVGCTFIIGTPGETAKELDETYEFIEKNFDKLMDVEINPLIPMPSTPLWDYAAKKGYVSKDMDWERLSDTGYLVAFNYDNYLYMNEAMPKDEFFRYVEKFTDLFKRITLRPKNMEYGEKTWPIEEFPARLKRLA